MTHTVKNHRRHLVIIAAAALALAAAAFGTISPSTATTAAATYRITGIEAKLGSAPATGSGNHDPVKKVILACPAGKVILGGAVAAYEFQDGIPHNTSRLSVTQMEPGLLTGGRYIWTAAVEESGIGTNNPWRLVARATCADRPPGYDFEGDSTDVNTDGSKEVAPDCLPGRKVIGGGAAIRSRADQERVGLTMARVDALGGLMRARAHAAPSGAADDWGLKATVICANQNIEGYEIRNATSSDDRRDWSRSIQTAFVTCSGSKLALTAGGALSLDAGGRANLGAVGAWGSTVGQATGHEPYPTPQRWGFVLARAVCAAADAE